MLSYFLGFVIVGRASWLEKTSSDNGVVFGRVSSAAAPDLGHGERVRGQAHLGVLQSRRIVEKEEFSRGSR